MSNRRAYALVGGAEMGSILWTAVIFLVLGIIIGGAIVYIALRNIGRIE
jgi:hypothetical protein